VSEDNIVHLHATLAAKARFERRVSMGEIVGALARTVAELRERGAASKDVALALRLALARRDGP
jgi:hypothetical protein